jgi:ABC-type dipeptide/oligopeptide/nickel transport system permease subunit
MSERRGGFVWQAARRFVRHRLAVAGVIALGLLSLSVLLAPAVAPVDPRTQAMSERLQRPSLHHPLGTDQFGRDLLSRILYGGRLSLLVGFISVTVGLVSGGTLGLVAGYVRSLDNLLMRLMDILGPGLVNVMLAVGVRAIPAYARVVRATVLSLRALPFCEASIALGAPPHRTIVREIVPNSVPVVLVYSSLQIGNAILLGAVLSYLGLGVQPPTPEWGVMVSEGRSWLQAAPYIATFPGCAIFLAVMAFNLIGDGLRDSLDVRLTEAR